MNLVANKKILFIGVAITFVIVVIFVVASLILRNSQNTNNNTVKPTSSSIETTSTLATSIGSSTTGLNGNTTNSAVTDLSLSDSTIKLPTVTLSSDPIALNSSSISFVSSSILSSVVSSKSSSIIISDLKSPTDLYVTNKDYKIWNVAWTTKTPTIGKLKYGTSPSNLDKVISDDRTALSSKSSYSHFVTITNSDTTLNQGNPTFYYKILSDSNEYGDGPSAFIYQNAPLLSSPSSPINAVVSLSKSVINNDAIILARIKTGTEYSEWVSSVISGTNSILNIGIARKVDLKSYATKGSTSKLEVSVLGPSGKIIGTKTDISLTNIEDNVINVTVTPTLGSSSSVVSSKASSIITQVIPSSSTTNIISAFSGTSSITSIPKTAIEDDLSLIAILVISLMILIGGTGSLYKINSKQNFGRRVLEDIYKDTDND